MSDYQEWHEYLKNSKQGRGCHPSATIASALSCTQLSDLDFETVSRSYSGLIC